VKMYMQPAMVALAERVETDLLNLYSRFTASGPLGIGGTALTEAVIDQAETALFTAKVPTSEPKYLVCIRRRTRSAHDRPVHRSRQGGPLAQAIDTGVLGRIKDFFVYRSQFVVQTGRAR